MTRSDAAHTVLEWSRGSAAEQSLPDTSLIICSRNRPRLLAETVASVLHGDAVPSEIIVVDQSDQAHAELASVPQVRGCDIRYLWTNSIGLSRANNVGIAAARHDILAFTHDDVLVAPGWFGALVRALLAAQPRGVVTGRVLPGRAEVPGGFVPTLKVDSEPMVYEGRIGRDELYPLNMAMFRSAVDAIGGFDERLGPGTWYPGGEDNDFGFRLLEAGYRILYRPEAVMYHRAWRSDYLALRWSYGRGQGAFYAKHLSLRDRYMLGRMTREVVQEATGALRNLGRNNSATAAHGVYLLALIAAAGRWLLTESRELPAANVRRLWTVASD